LVGFFISVHMGRLKTSRSAKKVGSTQTIAWRGRSISLYLNKNDTFGVYISFGTHKYRNTFKTRDVAIKKAKEEIEKYATNPKDSVVLYPLQHERHVYYDIEKMLKERCDGASIKEAVEFFCANYSKRLRKKMPVSECFERYLLALRGLNRSQEHLNTVKKHISRFAEVFATTFIDEISTEQISDYLNAQENRGVRNSSAKILDSDKWSPETKNKNRASLITFANYCQKVLKVLEENHFKEVPKFSVDTKDSVSIYTPSEMQQMLSSALETNLDILPLIVLQGFAGLRPSETHGERKKTPRLAWSAINLYANVIEVQHQKVRGRQARFVPLQENAKKWLSPFLNLTLSGAIWTFKESYTAQFAKLKELARVRSIQDGLRHSYASYRNIQTGDTSKTAQEMGNSESEIYAHYRTPVFDAQAIEWFLIIPPDNYEEKVRSWYLNKQVS
jgi:site-specific recombinase XerD